MWHVHRDDVWRLPDWRLSVAGPSFFSLQLGEDQIHPVKDTLEPQDHRPGSSILLFLPAIDEFHSSHVQ